MMMRTAAVKVWRGSGNVVAAISSRYGGGGIRTATLVVVAPAVAALAHVCSPPRAHADAVVGLAPPQTVAAAPAVAAAHGAHGELLATLRRTLRWVERRAHALWMLVQRTLYLFCVFAPAAATAPTLLLGHARLSAAWWAFFRDCIRSAGPCATKFAQWIATRPDLFPLDMCRHLEDLQSKVIYHTWADTEAALTHALGPQWATQLTIDWAPDTDPAAAAGRSRREKRPVVLGSGCIAQVIRGRTRGGTGSDGRGGDAVAIKIVHPGVRESIDADVAILRQVPLSRPLSRPLYWPLYRPLSRPLSDPPSGTVSQAPSTRSFVA